MGDVQLATVESLVKEACHLAPGGGEAVWLVGDTYTLKVSGAQTGGAFTLLEAVVPPGGGPPPHVHHREDVTFVVLEGELVFRARDREVPSPPGSVLYIPKGTVHGFTNVGATPARMLFLFTPAGMEGMFAEIGQPARAGLPAPPPSAEDVARMLAVAPKYGFELLIPAEQ